MIDIISGKFDNEKVFQDEGFRYTKSHIDVSVSYLREWDQWEVHLSPKITNSWSLMDISLP